MPRDYRDEVIAASVEREADLLDQIVDLSVERDSYRAVAVAGIHALHDLQLEKRRLEQSNAHLREQLRCHRSAA